VPSTDLADLRAALLAVAEPDRAPAMAAYMKDRFGFLGVGSVARRRAQHPFVRAWAGQGPAASVDVAASLWEEPEREFQYVGCDLLRTVGPRLPAGSLAPVRRLVASRSWWDTVDSLAKVVGSVVRAHPEEAPLLDRWVDPGTPVGDVDDPAMWVARAGILHQLGWGDAAQPEVVLRHCEAQIGHPGFFVRKAIGWALRDLARSRPEQVWAWVDAHPDLSALSRREATRRRP
jgi:3-methyladenine DNA glycosylase AlkD